MATPAEVIQFSRKLDWETVDCSLDPDLSGQERLTLLCDLAAQIHRAVPDTVEHAALVARYNRNLFDVTGWLRFRDLPLPDEATIPDEWTLKDHLFLRERRERDGPETFRAGWDRWYAIAHVKVLRRLWFTSWLAGRSTYKVQTIRCIKGVLAPTARVRVISDGWNAPWEQGAEYLIWLSEFGAGYYPPLIKERDGQKVIQHGFSVEYFHPARTQITGDYTAESSLEEVLEVLASYEQGKKSVAEAPPCPIPFS